MYYAIKFEDGRYMSFGSILNKQDPETAVSYTVWNGDGTSEYETEVRERAAAHVASWFTTDLSRARFFDNIRSARNAGHNGPFKFEIVEVELQAREK